MEGDMEVEEKRKTTRWEEKGKGKEERGKRGRLKGDIKHIR